MYVLWTLMIGWGFYLNKMEILAILLFLMFLLLSDTRKICWRYISIAIMTLLFNLFVFNLGYFDKNLISVTFLITEALVSANLSEYLSRLCINNLVEIYLFVSVSFLTFVGITILLSSVTSDYIYIHNLYVYNALIFVPSFLLMSIQMQTVLEKFRFIRKSESFVC